MYSNNQIISNMSDDDVLWIVESLFGVEFDSDHLKPRFASLELRILKHSLCCQMKVCVFHVTPFWQVSMKA